MGGPVRRQSLELEKGWNAIYLTVEPVDSYPPAVFTNSPVDIAATYDGIFSPRQFSSDPAANMLNQLGWGVWYAPPRPDSFLSDLSAIHGQKPYLLHAKAACRLEIAGEVEMPNVRWQPNAYNLVGFDLDSLAPPTFAQFFAGSTAHAESNVYRLVGGSWRKVLAPDTAAMRSGEAFWIHCNGNSNYQGPLKAETATFGGISLGLTGDNLVIRNETVHPLEAKMVHVVGNGNGLPLAIVIEIIGEEVGMESLKIPMTNGAWNIALPPLEAGGAVRIPLALRMEAMTQAEGQALLCIETDLGTQTWLPVTGYRED
ncbi:hypothetical protein [Pontiella sp.]|uniref:hypothetical protein n=1 Tax=Pontiella sp. TaxID=2837462 RepID=UPI00356A7C2A